MKFFPVCILVKIGLENALDDILERVKAFLDYENTMLKKVEKLGFFSKGLVNGFGQKSEIFLSLHFSQNRPGKVVERYSKKKKAFRN